MVNYTDEQKQIAKKLLNGSMSVEELRSATKLNLNSVNDGLKGMIKLRVVKKTKGDKYELIEDVIKGVKKERNFHVRMYIEGLSEHKEQLEKQMEALEDKLRGENIEVLELKKGEPLKQKENYSMYIDFEAKLATFSDIISLIVNYGPSSVELLQPEKVELKQLEAQNLLNDVSSAVHYYVGFILELMKEREKHLKESQNTSK